MDLSQINWHSHSDSSDISDNDADSAELQKQVSYLKLLFGKSNDDSDNQLNDIEDLFNSNLFVSGDLMAFHDQARLEDTEFEVLYKEENGRLSLAYERLPGIPKRIADQFATKIHTLDMSFNNIKDLSFLTPFKLMHTLILDNNRELNEMTLPFLPNIRILWLNKCDINNLPKWMHRLKVCTPYVKQLSMLGNPGCLSQFNGASTVEHNDYIMYVVGILERLEVLDDTKLSDIQRLNAKTHIGAYTMSGGPMKFMERFAGASNLLTFFKYDPRKARPMISSTSNSPTTNADNKPNSQKGQPIRPRTSSRSRSTSKTRKIGRQ